jgi:hypothetical protein
MFRQVLDVFADLYDATTACRLAVDAEDGATVRRAFLEAACGELVTADSSLSLRRRDEAIDHLLGALALLRDAVEMAAPADALVLLAADLAVDGLDVAAVALHLAAEATRRLAELPPG